jgi:N-acetylglucosamine kinase-like BadF-type ATPase
VVATNDAVTAHLGALAGEAGVVIVAGTGAIALAASDDGRWARADGYGTLLGDDGGGYWIGRAGLASALRAADGRGGSAALRELAEARFGTTPTGSGDSPRGVEHTREWGVPCLGLAPREFAGEPPVADAALLAAGADPTGPGTAAPAGHAVADGALRGAETSPGGAGAHREPLRSKTAAAGASSRPGVVRAVYDAADPVAVVASFARDVAAAARAGDAAACDIWAAAGRELARTAVAAARQVGVDGPFSFSGGLFAAGDLLLDPLREALPGPLRAPCGDALDGAGRLLEPPALFTELIYEIGAP